LNSGLEPEAELTQARVLVSYGGQGIAELADGTRIDIKYRRSVGRPCCGDRVLLDRADDHSASVARLLPRDNTFVRGDARQRPQVIASNLDRVLVVVAPSPAPSTDLVERYLVAVHSMGIEPVIVLNKAELLEALALDSSSPLAHLEEYRSLGYEVILTSCKGPPGVAALECLLESGTSILVGQSGVGKSSLINRVLPDLELQTGALSKSTGKGTHTTTTTIMYTLPGGGKLIDSPGVWEYGLWRMEQGELAHGFREFRPQIGHCRFNDCRHASEPDCAVRAAVEDGRVSRRRHEAYLRLLAQGA
jgi:ribosome biogenesis GTPase